MEHYISKSDETIKQIVSTCFPSYKGKTIKLSSSIPTNLNSYWDGGSRNYYVFYELTTGKILPVDSNHPIFERDKPNQLKELPIGILLVKHCIFCGKDLGITIYAREENFSKMIPKSMDLSEPEKIVLYFTKSYKNTYGGRTNIRFDYANRKTKITWEQWKDAQIILIEKGLLRKNLSITPEGRNHTPTCI